MKRKDFLKAACTVFGVAAVASFIEGCKKTTTTPSPQGPTVNFTLDLTSSSNSALNTVGGSVYSNGVVVVRKTSSSFVAVAQACTHQGCTIAWNNSSSDFVCPCHGGVYDVNGNVVSGPPPGPIKKYTVTQSGNVITIQG